MSSGQLLLTGAVLLALAYLGVIGSATLLAALRAGGRRDEPGEERDAVTASRLTMPVSVVIAAGAHPQTANTLRRVLDMAYPEFEAIVVVDTGAAILQAMIDEWKLESREFFYRRRLDTAPVRRILRSQRDARLMVVEQDGAGRSDALNCGVELARYRFVAALPPGVTFDSSALIRAMAPVIEDPVAVVGVACPVERASRDAEPSVHASFQQLRSIRSLMFTRLFWRSQPHSVTAGTGVSIWRRDAVIQANGFRPDAVDPELDMMFRLQPAGVERRRFVRSHEAFGQTDVLSAGQDRIDAGRRQRASLEAIASRLAAAHRSRYFLAEELIGPAAQAWIAAAVAAGAMVGWFSWTAAISAVLALSFGSAAVTAAALLVRGAQPLPAIPREELRRLLLLAPLELTFHRPARAVARLSAFVKRPPSN
ncbi:MAG: hypothetical protein JSU08_16030 [Acidobacteria bacterium]|nr:hypothetical protein [Acidobacteriota bacterium]